MWLYSSFNCCIHLNLVLKIGVSGTLVTTAILTFLNLSEKIMTLAWPLCKNYTITWCCCLYDKWSIHAVLNIRSIACLSLGHVGFLRAHVTCIISYADPKKISRDTFVFRGGGIFTEFLLCEFDSFNFPGGGVVLDPSPLPL